MVTERETVGVVGTGIMGAPMARNLAKAGFAVVAYNRTPEKARALESDGVAVAGSIAEVGRRATIVITMAPGSVFIDMSTISPGETRALAARLADRGIAMLDAPVSGGSWGAQQATLDHHGWRRAGDVRSLPAGVRCNGQEHHPDGAVRHGTDHQAREPDPRGGDGFRRRPRRSCLRLRRAPTC